MLDIFRQKPKPWPKKTFFNELGELAEQIIDAVSEENDLEIALKGAATISPIIRQSRKEFKLDVKPRSTFARYLIVLEERDLAKMAAMTRTMANALREESDVRLRGVMVESWFSDSE